MSMSNDNSLQDIDLNNANVSAQKDDSKLSSKGSRSKNNSLKRFFKLSKRHGDELDENQAIGQVANDDNNLTTKKASSTTKRFSLRLGNLQRHGATTNLTKSPLCDEPGEKKNAKGSLKGSISTYWNMIFKKVKKEQSSEEGEIENEQTVATVDFTTSQSKGDLETIDCVEKVEKIENLANILSENPVIEPMEKSLNLIAKNQEQTLD